MKTIPNSRHVKLLMLLKNQSLSDLNKVPHSGTAKAITIAHFQAMICSGGMSAERFFSGTDKKQNIGYRLVSTTLVDSLLISQYGVCESSATCDVIIKNDSFDKTLEKATTTKTSQYVKTFMSCANVFSHFVSTEDPDDSSIGGSWKESHNLTS